MRRDLVAIGVLMVGAGVLARLNLASWSIVQGGRAMASKTGSGGASNVLGGALKLHGTDPMTGYFRDGYCNTDANDHGSHTLAGIVTSDFLEFSKQRGNDLATPHPPYFAGLKEGCRWCLCISRWKEAFDARGKYGDKIVPKVVLEATHKRALDKATLQELKQFAVDAHLAGGESGSSGSFASDGTRVGR